MSAPQLVSFRRPARLNGPEWPDVETSVPLVVSPAEPFPIVGVMDGDAPPPAGVLVRDLLVDRDISVWAGHGGAGKSTLLAAAALGIVLGRPVFGSLDVLRAGPVLLVAPEDGLATTRMVMEALVAGHGLTPSDRAILRDGVFMVTDAAVVNLTADARRLARTAQDIGAVAVFLDPLANLLGGASEREEDIAARTYDALRRHVCRDAEAGVLLLHHNRKPRDEAADGGATPHEVRGSGGWTNGARLVLAVRKRAGQNRVTLSAVKANRLRADISHELTLEIEANPSDPARWLSCRVVDANLGALSAHLTPGVGRPLNANEIAGLVALDDRHEPGRRLSWSRWRDEAGFKSRGDTFRSIRERLLDAQLVDAKPTGKASRNGSPEYSYALSDTGRIGLASGWTHAEGVKL